MTSALKPEELDRLKRAAARRAVAEIEDGMIVGLGSGTTAAFALEAVAVRVAEGLRIVGIPTSEKTAARARQLHIPLASFESHRRIDLTIDGADEIERRTLNLIKGGGGSLLREKIVAAASERMIVAADESKLVERLGANVPLPVEIVPFGWQSTVERLEAIGCRPRLRATAGQPFTTDGGGYIADCTVAGTIDPAALETQLAGIVGVIETGFFIGMASRAVIGGLNGIEVIER